MALASPAGRRWAAAAAILGAAFILWLSGRMQRPLDEPAVGGAPQPIPSASGGAGWTPPAGAPLAATAGMRRQLGGDWTLPDPKVDRTLVKAPGQDEPLREPHVLMAPQAPEGLQLLPPINAQRPVRSMLPAQTQAAAPVAAPAVSTAPAQAAAAPQPAPVPPPQPKRRVFIPIPDPKAKGIREAHVPVYRVEPTATRTTDGSAVPAGIATDPGQAVRMIDGGDGYLHPLSSGSAISPWPNFSLKNKRLQRAGDKP